MEEISPVNKQRQPMTSPVTEQFSVRMLRALWRRMLADANGMSFHAPIIPYRYTVENYQPCLTIIIP